MNRKQKIIISITGITIVLLALVGLTYGYYLTVIKGNLNPNSISLTTADLELVYGETGSYVIGENETIEPNKTFEPKTFTVTNTGDDTIDSYAVVLENVSTTYASTTDKVTEGQVTTFESTTKDKENDFTLVVTCKNQDNEECNGYNAELLESNGILLTNSIEPEEIQTYTAVLTYNDTGKDQSADMNKKYTAKFNIIDTKDTIDISGTVSDYELGDYVQTNSTKRVSVINPDGSYKIVGLEVGKHELKVCGSDVTNCTKSNAKLTETISIVKGDEASVNNDTNTITITEDLRTVNADIDDSGTNMSLINISGLKTLAYHILNNGAQVLNATTGELEIDKTYEEKTQITKVSDGTDMTDVGIFTAPDDYGTSYYFRGPIKNNYVDFAGFTWRIVRINGDGSVRLILDGTLDKTCVEYNNDNSCASYAASSTTEFNSSYNDNAYVGYMYGLAGTTTKANRCLKLNGTTVTDNISTYGTQETCEANGGKWTTTAYEATHANVKDSTIKTVIDTFYVTYIENGTTKQYEQYLADTMFCGDKSLADQDGTDNNIGNVTTQLGYGTGTANQTYYAATERLYYSSGTTSITTANPTLKCAEGQTNTYSRYTKEEQNRNNVLTNGDLKHPIALLSADELVLAGAFIGKKNQAYYLYDAYANGTSISYWWSLSPYYFNGVYAYEFYSNATNASLVINNVDNSFRGSRPVINLKADVLVESGDGSSGSGAYKVRLAS